MLLLGKKQKGFSFWFQQQSLASHLSLVAFISGWQSTFAGNGCSKHLGSKMIFQIRYVLTVDINCILLKLKMLKLGNMFLQKIFAYWWWCHEPARFWGVRKFWRSKTSDLIWQRDDIPCWRQESISLSQTSTGNWIRLNVDK